MIGKPEWFTYRIFGWGVAPRTWQGALYIIILAAVIASITVLPIAESIKPWIIGVIVFIAVLDTLHIMTQLDKVHDERQRYHQLIIERNCSFAAIIALLAVAAYQSYLTVQQDTPTGLTFNWSILAVLIAMLVTKIGSTIYVRTRM